MQQCPGGQPGVQGPLFGRGETFLVAGDLWDPSGVPELAPQGHRAVWGGCPQHWGKHIPATLLPPSLRWVS